MTLRNRSGYRGFTLIELMVVIVVILILLGIAAGIGAWAVGNQEDQLARTALVNTQLIYDEYSSTMGGSVTGWPAGQAGVSTLVAGTKNLAAFKGHYSKIPPQLLDIAGNAIKDPWSSTLHYVPANTATAGGPQRTTAYFFSAGRDTNASTTGDNLYSYDAIR